MSNESDGVEDLERRVTELEATVRGLTEELVEANERIRQLEDQHDLLEATGVEGHEQSQPQSQPDQAVDVGAEASADGGDTPTETEGQGEADEAKGEDAQEQDDSEFGDDIIVA